MNFGIPLIDLDDTHAISLAKKSLHNMEKIWRKEILTLTILKFLHFLSRCLQLITIARLLSIIVLEKNHSNALYFLLILGISSVLILAFTYLIQVATAGFSAKAALFVRLELLRQVENDLQKEKIQRGMGEQILLFERQSEAISPYFTRYIPQKYLSALTPLVICGLVFYISWICGVFMILIVPMIPLYLIIIGKGTVSESQKEWKSLGEMGSYFFDRVRGITTLSIFSNEAAESDKILSKSQSYMQSALKVLRIAFLSSAAIDFFTTIIIASIAIVIGLGMIDYVGFFSRLSLSDALILLVVVPEFFSGIKKLGVYYHDKTYALGAMVDFQQSGFFGVENKQNEVNSVVTQTDCSGVNFSGIAISAHGLNFQYPDQEKLFDDFNLSVNWGEGIFLKGANGTGKSTLIDLIHGFKNPCEGSVLVAGLEVAKLSREQVSPLLAWAGQRSRILAGSLRYNLCMGREISDSELLDSLSHYFDIRTFFTPYAQGLDSLLQEDGKSISGGERQKISLARAVLKDAPILLLDEPFTYLDSASISLFIKGLEENINKRTVILTSHQNHEKKLADFKIIHLDAKH